MINKNEKNRKKIEKYNTLFVIGILIICFIFCTNISFSQSGDDNPAQTNNTSKLLKNAKKALEYGDIFTAIDCYKKYVSINPDNYTVNHDLGQLLYRERNYKEAEEYLYKAYKSKPKKYLQDLFDYALCHKTLGNYENAINGFNKYMRESRGNQNLKEYARIAKIHIDMIQEIPEIKANSNNILVFLLDSNINKPHIEFSPIPFEDNKLIYGSLKESQINYYDIYQDKLPVRKFYVAQKNGDKWKNLGEFDKNINGKDVNTGNGAFSGDKKRFYFSRCKLDETDKKIKCKIYVSNLEHNEWQEPKELPEIINAKKYTTTMPALGISKQNSDVLYFVSDREGGRGGLDIWYSIYDRNKKEWKEPRNCGKKINTLYDEITPYYNIDIKTLFFSSNGHPTIGGFDIFKSFGEEKSFENLQNLGFPINSSYDDLYFIYEDSRQKGYFTSNRPGGHSLRHETCCDDIYEFVDKGIITILATGRVFGITDPEFYKTIEKDYKTELVVNIDILDTDEDQLQLLNDFPVNLYIKDKNNSKEIFVRTCYTTNGRYNFNLEQGNDYFIQVNDINAVEKRLPFTTKNIFKSDTIHLDALILNTFPKDPIIVKNIYYDFNDYRLRNEAKNTINSTIYSLMVKFPNIIIEISSHTDSIGSDKLNEILSQNRAQSVVNYLIEKGISKDRLIARGYGKTMPIAPNSNPDGSDNPEGRQKNRRTEFRIVGLTEELEDIKYDE